MSNPLICGVDGSDESMAAAAAAARLARGLRSRLVLAQVTDHNIAGRGSEDLGEQHLFTNLRRGLDEIEVDCRTLHGEPARALCELAADEDAALMVMGSRGRGMVKSALLGSVSWKVVRGADHPVMVVPPAAAGHGTSSATVVCGVDDSREAREAARVAAELAAALGLDLVLLHSYLPSMPTAAIPAPGMTPPIDHEQVERRQRADAQRLVDAVTWEAGPVAAPRTRIEAGDAVTALERVAEEERAELIVLGTHGRGLLPSALAGSTSARLAASVSRPVVLVPERVSVRAGGGAEPLTGRAG